MEQELVLNANKKQHKPIKLKKKQEKVLSAIYLPLYGLLEYLDLPYFHY